MRAASLVHEAGAAAGYRAVRGLDDCVCAVVSDDVEAAVVEAFDSAALEEPPRLLYHPLHGHLALLLLNARSGLFYPIYPGCGLR